VDFSSNQFVKGFHDMCIRLYGTAGTADTHYGGPVRITGDNPWTGTEKDETGAGATANIRDFIDSVRSGRPLNNAASAVQSTLTAVLGRMAAYQGRTVTWDEMMRRKEKLEADLRL